MGYPHAMKERTPEEIEKTKAWMKAMMAKAAAEFNNNATYSPHDDTEKDATLEMLLAVKAARERGGMSVAEGVAMGGLLLGWISVFLNIFILIVLIVQRRYAFKHVFYILLLNFVIQDFLKGCGLITFSSIKLDPHQKVLDKILRVKIEQITIIHLKFCNLGTILNVLLITLNEFFFIKFPLNYHHYITRLRAVIVVVMAWVGTALLTTLTTITRSQRASFNVIPCPANFTNALNPSNNTNQQTTTPNDSGDGSTRKHYRSIGDGKCTWRESADEENEALHNIAMFTIIAFTIFCLIVVLVCYVLTFLIIYNIKKQDAQLMESSRISRKISEQSTRRYSEVSFETFNANSTCISLTDEEPRIKRQLLRRYKYVIVIGCVILVYMLYLISYTVIQILQYVRIRKLSVEGDLGEKTKERETSYYIQISLQMLVGLHAVVQPLCYFRIKEFRRFTMRTLRLCGESCHTTRCCCVRLTRCDSRATQSTYQSTCHGTYLNGTADIGPSDALIVDSQLSNRNGYIVSRKASEVPSSIGSSGLTPNWGTKRRCILERHVSGGSGSSGVGGGMGGSFEGGSLDHTSSQEIAPLNEKENLKGTNKEGNSTETELGSVKISSAQNLTALSPCSRGFEEKSETSNNTAKTVVTASVEGDKSGIVPTGIRKGSSGTGGVSNGVMSGTTAAIGIRKPDGGGGSSTNLKQFGEGGPLGAGRNGAGGRKLSVQFSATVNYEKDIICTTEEGLV